MIIEPSTAISARIDHGAVRITAAPTGTRANAAGSVRMDSATDTGSQRHQVSQPGTWIATPCAVSWWMTSHHSGNVRYGIP